MGKKKAVASKAMGGISKDLLKQLGGMLAQKAGLPAEMGSMLAGEGAKALGLKKGGKVRVKGRGGYARGGNVELSPGIGPMYLPAPVHYPIGYDRSQMYARGGEVSAKPGQIMMKGGKLTRAKGIGGDILGLAGNYLLPGIGGMVGKWAGDQVGSIFGLARGGRVGKQMSQHTAF